GEHEDRGHDRLIVQIGGDTPDELLVDLDRVDREALEVDQRGSSRSEVIDRDADAHPPDGFEKTDGPARLLNRQRLGDLELEPAGVDVRRPNQLADQADEITLVKLTDRDVHAETEVGSAGLLPCLQ